MAEDDDTPVQDSLLPYDRWTEEALRLVVMRALDHAAALGLPGGHHFYITFRTDHPDAVVPERIVAKYPEEMTIVLQHQFRNLSVDAVAQRFSVTLDFSGIPTPLTIPVDAITAFADPEVRFGLRFEAVMPEDEAAADEPPEAAPALEADTSPPAGDAAIVSLDAFRRRTPPKQ
jgi:hypothetical protein